MQLRDYQLEAVQAIETDWQNHKSVLLVMATGGGKTQVFCELLDKNVKPGSRGLVLVHRKELVEQSRNRLIDYWPNWAGRTGIVMAERDECNYPMTFATVQTLSSERRLERLLNAGKIDYVVTDEAHHSEAESYQHVYAALQNANPELLHLGVTATPIRADRKGLVNTYEKVSATYDIKYLVSRKYLVPPRWLAVQTGISLANVKINYSDGERDYSSRQLADVFETRNCFDLVVQTHREYAHERQAVAFTTTVSGAHELAEVFSENGYSAEAADAGTNKQERQRILNDFRNGKTKILCNVGLYTEGLDVPEVSCIHQVRPTQSDGLYLQMIGRGLRLYPGKSDALILDYAPAESRQIVMLGDVLGSAVRKDAYIKDGEEGEVIGGFTYDGDYHWLEGSPAEIITRQLNYLDDTCWRWHRSSDGWMSLGMGKGSDEIQRTAVISPPDDSGNLRLYAVWKNGDDWKSAKMREGLFDDLSIVAEGWADQYAEPILAGKGKRWHKEEPSEGQIKFAQRLHVWRDGMSRGECAAEITHKLAMMAIGC